MVSKERVLKDKGPVFSALIVFFVAVGCLFLAACSNPISSNPVGNTNTGTSADGDALLKSWGIDTNLGSPSDSTGKALAANFNPLGYKTARLEPRFEIFQAGAANENGNHVMLFDDNTNNSFSSPSWADTSDSWAKNPHASAAGNTDGSGYDSIVTVVFKPSDSSKTTYNNYTTSADNPGTAYLHILSGTSASSRTVKDISLSGTFHLCPASHLEEIPYLMGCAIGDIDGDGYGEIGVVIGNTFIILDDAKHNYGELVRHDFRTEVHGSTYSDAKLEITRIAAGDVNQDGYDEFIVTDGYDAQDTTANVYLYGAGGAGWLSTFSLSSGGYSLEYAAVAVGDINGDSKPDVVFAGDNLGSDGTIDVLVGTYGSSNGLTFLGTPYQTTRCHDWKWEVVPPLVCFDPDSRTSTVKELIAVDDEILTYNSTSASLNKLQTNYKPYRDMIVAGDVNQDGKDELVYYGDDGSHDLIVYGGSSTSLSKIADVSASQDNDYCFSLCLADVDGDSVVVSYQSRTLQFANPQVVAVLASPPYYTDYAGSQLGNCGTTLSYSSTASTSSTNTFTISASFTVGYSAETPLVSVESSLTLGASFSYGTTKETTRTETESFSTAAGVDGVLYECTPFDVYTYKIVRSPKSNTINTTMVICIPRTPQLITKERSLFNALPNNPVSIGSSTLVHTMGKPATYPTYDDISTIINKSGGIWYSSRNIAIGQGGTTSSVSVSQEECSSSTYTAGVSITQDISVSVAGVTFGTSRGFAYDYQYSFSTGSGTEISGSTPDLSSTASASLAFSYGIAAYKTTVTGQNAPFMVVTYWVSNATAL